MQYFFISFEGKNKKDDYTKLKTFLVIDQPINR